MSAGLDRVWRIAAIVVVAACGAVGLLPGAILVGGMAWLAFLVAALSGWGYLVVRALRTDDVDVGLRVAWGMAAIIALGGVFVAVGICTRPVVLGLVAIGVAGFGWRELVAESPSWHSVRALVERARSRPAYAIVVGLVSALAVFYIVGAIAKLDRNPWDDDVSYTPLVRRLLDAGDLVEPFSFRRLAAYGGQTLLLALGGARGTLANVHLVDRGLGFLLVLLLLVGHVRQLRGVPTVWAVLLALVVIVLPDIAINTASYWVGAALFYALYRTLTAVETHPRVWLVVALVGAALCTLRQNFIPVVVVTSVISLWDQPRMTWFRVAGVATLVMANWWIAAFSSSRTFLFPFVGGTWNDSLSLSPTGSSWTDDLAFLVSSALDTQPIVVIPILFVVLAVAKDQRATKPLTALFVGSALGFLLLAKSFTGADAFSLWRYAFGFALPLTLALALEATNEHEERAVVMPALGRWVVIAALLVQLAAAREGIGPRLAAMGHDIREVVTFGMRGDPTAVVEAQRYSRMQAVVPAGTRLAVMVDDPAFLDYTRNNIANLDTPGFASPRPGLPTFCGPQAWQSYLVRAGYRYLAFVRPDYSRYFYRRQFWIWRLFNDSELFQAMSLHAIDAIDTFVALALHTRVLFDDEGLVVLDLGMTAPVASCPQRESIRREEALRRHMRALGVPTAASLFTQHDVVFADGFSNIVFIDENDPTWPAADSPHAGRTPARWMHRRAHLRVRTGGRAMHLVLRGKVRLAGLHALPRLDVSVGGQWATSTTVDSDGNFLVDAAVPDASGWTDVFVVFSTIGTPEKQVRDLRIAPLMELTWEPKR